jgi:hypothetical protein
VRDKETLESLQRFFVEDNVIDVVNREPTVVEAELDRLKGTLINSTIVLS